MNFRANGKLLTSYSSRINCFNDNTATRERKRKQDDARTEKAFRLELSRFALAFICQENTLSFARKTEYKEEISICEMYPVIVKYLIKHASFIF